MVQSGGSFDHKTGGHLYLRDVGLVIEFPAGASILLPSAALRHGNTPTQPGETRTSVTQYAAGGLFRWVDQGFRTRRVMEAQDPDGAEALDAEQDLRWREAVHRFSKADELQEDHKSVFHW